METKPTFAEKWRDFYHATCMICVWAKCISVIISNWLLAAGPCSVVGQAFGQTERLSAAATRVLSRERQPIHEHAPPVACRQHDEQLFVNLQHLFSVCQHTQRACADESRFPKSFTPTWRSRPWCQALVIACTEQLVCKLCFGIFCAGGVCARPDITPSCVAKRLLRGVLCN